MYQENVLTLKTYDREGQLSEHTLRYRQHGNGYVVAACNEQHTKPDWYLNLKSEPIVEIRIGGEEHFASAAVPVGQGRIEIWPLVEELARDVERRMPRNVTGVVITPMD